MRKEPRRLICLTKERPISDRFFSRILKNTECKFELNRDVAALTSVGISAIARAVAYPDSEEKLVTLINTLNENEIPFIVVGRMSNVLLKDHRYNGILIKTTKITKKTVAENKVTLSCGSLLSKTVMEMAELQLGGLEGLFAIPGTVGGMVRQNAGAFGYEISDRLVNAFCYLPATCTYKTYTNDDMRFSYRNSAIAADGAVLLNATLEFVPKSREDILSSIREYREKRRLTQPIEYPSLGSVFKRYRGVSAGYYIDKSGLKGYTIGGAQISKKHAGFIVNVGGATADDYLMLTEYVKEKVYAEFGIELEEEIQVI